MGGSGRPPSPPHDSGRPGKAVSPLGLRPAGPGARQAIILAGGQGTRLRPLTLARPKPVVPLVNRPFLAYQLALLRSHGVHDVILSCAYRVDDVRTALEGDPGEKDLRYVVEAEPLGTGGGVRNAADLARGAIFVLNGDILTDADLTAMHRFHAEGGGRLTIMLVRVPDPRAYGVVETAADGRIVRFREKPAPDEPITTDTVNGGIYLLDAALLQRIPTGRPVSIEREVFPRLIDDGVPCLGWCPPAYWRDIGSPRAYHAAQLDLLRGRVRTPLTPAGAGDGGRFIGPDAVVAADARIEAPAVIGRGARVETGARVGPLAVLGERVRVGPGARVVEAVLWEDVTVGAGARLEGCVVADHARIGARAVVAPGALVAAGAVIADGVTVPGPESPRPAC
jgi:mannose-1-phosphate guanylyltransferase